MDRIIIIDDSGIQHDLNHFLKANKNHIRLDSDIHELSSGSNSLIKEIIESYENKYRIKFQSKDLVYIFKVNEILYLKAKQDKTEIHVTNGDPVELDSKLEKYKDQLAEYLFLNVHPEYIVNINHISRISEDQNLLLLSNEMKIPMSEDEKMIIINRLDEYIKL